MTHRLAASVSGVNYPWVDIGIAGEHLVLAATELGLSTCWIGWIKPRVVARIVAWPAFVKPVVVVTVGYPPDRGRAPSPVGTSITMPAGVLSTWRRVVGLVVGIAAAEPAPPELITGWHGYVSKPRSTGERAALTST
jgi:hypothetical protein